METLKDYDVKHGKILEWEETAEGWKNGYMTIPDDDTVVKGWGVSKPYQMRMFCETAKREVIFEVMRHLEEFEPKEQRKIARLAFSETAKRTYGDVDIHFQEEPSSIVVRMASPQEYIFSCILYGTGEWSYPDTSIREAFEDAAMFYKNISEKQEQVARTTDVRVLYEAAQGLKRSVADGLIPENYYNRFVRISGDILRRADSLAEGNVGYQLYNEYAKKTGFDLSDYSCPKRKEHVSAVLELMDKTFALFPEFGQSGRVYSFYSGMPERVSEERNFGRQVIPGGRG